MKPLFNYGGIMPAVCVNYSFLTGNFLFQKTNFKNHLSTFRVGQLLFSLIILGLSLNVNAQQVKGPNVKKVVYQGGQFTEVNSTTWVETKSDHSAKFNFKVTDKDEWSVYLIDASRDISIQLDLWTKEIYIYWERPNRRVLYKIVSSSASGGDSPASIDTKKTYFIFAKHSNKVMDVSGISLNDQALIHQWELHKGKNQQWKFISADEGYYIIKSVHSGKVMDIKAVSKEDGAVVQQYTQHGRHNQQFKFVKEGSYYRIICRHSGKSLEVNGNNNNNGQAIVQRTWHGGPNQLWKLTPVSNSSNNQSGEKLAGYERCASEGEAVSLTNPTDVAYGAKGKFVYRKGLTGRIVFNNETFGDPVPGVPKFGFCREAVIDPNEQAAGPSGYDRCASEGDTKTFSQPTDIAYGANGKFVFRKGLTGRVTFNNETFGDPVPGVHKFGFCRQSAQPVNPVNPINPNPPIVDDNTVDVVVWEMDDGSLNSIVSWIKSRVASINVPYCYRDSYGRGAGSVPSSCRNSSLEKDATGGPAGLCYPKCKTGYSGVGPVCWQSCPTNFRDDGAFCRKPDEYGRGVGRIPDKKPCSDWNAAYRDDGTSCWLDTYGRGAGYDFFFKDGMKNCEKDHGKGNCEMWGAVAYPKCKPGYKNVACCLCEPVGGPGIKVTAFERYKCNSNEDLYGALCYPKCKPGYKAVGCCVCTYECPPGFGADIGVSCTKKTYGRGVGELSTCPPHLIRDETGGPAGLCYPKCKAGYHGVGPVCWMDCPPGLTACGAGCASSDFDCASTTFDQIMSPLIATANIATLGLSKPATGAVKAGQTAVKVGSKVIHTSSKIGKYTAKAIAALQQVDDGIDGGKVVVRYLKKKVHNPGAVITETKTWTERAYNAYQLYEEEFVNTEFVNQTSADINRELESKLHPEYAQTVKKYYARVVMAEYSSTYEIDGWEIAQYALLAAGMADPTGLVDVAAAYAHPVCNTVEPFPKLPSEYLK